MKLLISACLLGIPCRYDGRSVEYPEISQLALKYQLVPFCPEIYGGLPTPRLPSEIQGERVVRIDGDDVTAQYKNGAEQALRLCKILNCKSALLKLKSPSCGKGMVYDGSFSSTLALGDGITAAHLMKNGISVYGENEIEKLLKEGEE